MRALRRHSVRRGPENLVDDSDAGAVAHWPYADAHLLARNRERNGDQPTPVPCDAVAARVQVLDDEFAAI
jgi:hypothetical protein